MIKQIELDSIYLTKTMFKGLSDILDKNEDYRKDYILENYEDLFDINKINFYYILLKDILKCNIYIYQIPFLSETRNKIKKIINANIENFNNSLKQKRDHNDRIEYVLRSFIEYDYYRSKSIKVYKEKMESTSRMVSNASNPLDSIISNNPINYGMIGNQANSSSSGYFSGSSFKKVKEHSGRNFEGYEEEETESEWDMLKRTQKNDIAFKFLINSSFEYKFYEENNKIKEQLSEIRIQNNKEGTNFKTVKSENEILNNNYKMLLKFLEDTINKIKSNFENNFEFKITFEFNSNNVVEHRFNTNCLYQLNIENENPAEFKDFDIFNNTNNEVQGLSYLLNELNARRD